MNLINNYFNELTENQQIVLLNNEVETFEDLLTTLDNDINQCKPCYHCCKCPAFTPCTPACT